MLSIDDQKLAEDWIKYHLSQNKNEECRHFSAWETLDKLVREDPELAWVIMEEIRRLDSSDLILSSLAAGPLEDLLALHGRQFIERVETLASQDPGFHRMAGGVWRNNIADDIWRRLKKVAGPSF